MSDLIKVADEINEWAKWCHDNNVKAEVQRTMYKAADEIERLTAQVERFSYLETDWKRRNHIIESQAERIAELEAALREIAKREDFSQNQAYFDLVNIAKAALKGDNDGGFESE